MRQQVIFRNTQEIQVKDWNNMQAFMANAIEGTIYDAIAPGRYFTGFTATKTAATTVEISAGRMYDAGKIYGRDDTTSKDFFNDVPLSQLKKVLLTVSKSQVEEEVEPRGFLTDVENETVTTQAVATWKTNLSTINAIAGSEAAQPVVPATPIDQVAIAVITLDTDGVKSIERLTDNVLPQVYANLAALAELETWRMIQGREIDTLKSALAALNRLLGGFVTKDEFATFLSVFNEYRKKTDDAYALASKTDFRLSFHDALLNDTTADTDYSGYDAAVVEGIRFPADTSEAGHLSLFNANDPDVTVVNNFMLPKYTHKERIGIDGYDAEHRIASYSSETTEVVQGTGARMRLRFGDGRTWNTWVNSHVNGRSFTQDEIAAYSGQMFDTFGIDGETWGTINGEWFRRLLENQITKNQVRNPQLRTDKVWIDLINEPYTFERKTTNNVTGQGCAQTILNTQPMWLTQLGLFFTRKGASGDVTVLITECPDDQHPSFSNVIAQVTLAHADIEVGTGFEGSGLPALVETKVAIPPTFLMPGRRYGICLITQGDHWVALGPDYKDASAGSFFFAENNVWNPHPTATDKDMKVKVYGARFSSPQVYVDLNETTVTGGVEDIDILADQFTPDGTAFRFEANIGGTWYPLTDDYGDLSGANLQTGQAVVKLRAVFQGTLDLMPALGLGSSRSRVIMSNSKTAFLWASEDKDVGGGSTTQNILVRARLERFDDAHHTCVCKIKPSAASIETADSVSDLEQSDGTIIREWSFTLASATQIFQVEVTGTTDDAGILFHVGDMYCYAAA